jgi:hypothetical protein
VAEAVDGGRVSRIDGAPLPTPVAVGLGTPIDLVWSDATQRRLAVADAAAGRVVEIDLDRPPSRHGCCSTAWATSAPPDPSDRTPGCSSRGTTCCSGS